MAVGDDSESGTLAGLCADLPVYWPDEGWYAASGLLIGVGVPSFIASGALVHAIENQFSLLRLLALLVGFIGGVASFVAFSWGAEFGVVA